MNRAFLIILAPALLAAALYLGLGFTVPIRVGLVALALVGLALLLRRRKRPPRGGP